MNCAEEKLGRRGRRTIEIRARLEAAAYELFQKQNIDNTSIEQICEEADVARRTFYLHFANKQELLQDLALSKMVDRMEPIMSDVIAAHTTTRDRLRGLAETIKIGFGTMTPLDRRLMQLAPTVVAGNPEKEELNRAAIRQSFFRLIESGLEMGDVSTEFSPDVLVLMMLGTIHFLGIAWSSSNPDFNMEKDVDELLIIFQRIICK